MPSTVKGWWFSEDRTLPHGDGRRIRVGRTLVHRGPVVPCESGLHFSSRAIDALNYANGNLCWRVEGAGEIVPHGDPVDKYACSRRTHLWVVDAERVLRRFARWCALSVVHEWDAPAEVVRYLRTGDETIWAVARAAATGAAGDATNAAAMDAAWAAACAATNAAAIDAYNAMWDATQAAARDASMYAAWVAAGFAAGAAQNRALERMLRQAHEGTLDYDRPLRMPRRKERRNA